MKKLIPIVLIIISTRVFAVFANDELTAKDAVTQLNRIKQSISQVGVPSEQSGECDTCHTEDPLDKIVFTSCNNRKITRCRSDDTYLNDQMKKSFENAKKIIGANIYSEDFLKIAKCINAGLNSTPVGRFYNCRSDRDMIKWLKQRCRPCPTKEMVGTLAAEILMASKCLGRNYRKILPIFMHESRFMPNVISATYAGGVGQMTRPAIQDMNRLHYKITNIGKNNASCGYFEDIPEMSDNRICAKLYTPPNPRQNIIYGIRYQEYIESESSTYSPKALVDKWIKYRWKDRKLTEDQIEEFMDILLHVSYNAGKGVALPAFQALRDNNATAQLPFEKFKKTYFELLDKNAGDEPATYHNDIVRDARRMEKESGADCTIY